MLALLLVAVGALVMLLFYKYLKVTIDFTSGGPSYVCICTGGFMLLLGTLGCCCTAKGQPVLLYIVSMNKFFNLLYLVKLKFENLKTWIIKFNLTISYEGL